MKVMRTGGVVGGDAGEGMEAGGVDGRLAAFGDLESAFDEEEGFGGDEELILVEGVAGDEEVGDAGFVLERDEAVAFGSGGALAADDHARYRDGDAMVQIEQVAGTVGSGYRLTVIGGERCLLRRGAE